MSKWNSGAKDGGANQKKTTLPPPSKEYLDNYDLIFRKPSGSFCEMPTTGSASVGEYKKSG